MAAKAKVTKTVVTKRAVRSRAAGTATKTAAKGKKKAVPMNFVKKGKK